MKMKLFAFEKSVGAVVYRKKGDEIRYLFLFNNYWGFPKGHPEAGEDEEMTLRRETMEESGISDLEIMKGFRFSNFYFYAAKGREKEKRLASGKGIFIFKRAVFYLARTEQENVAISHEHIAFKWLGYEEALGYIRYANIRKLFRKAHRFLLSGN